jgi:hypothetical protein
VAIGTSVALEAIAETILGFESPWLTIILAAGAWSFDTTASCATDPPAFPTFSGTDALDFVTLGPGAPSSVLSKVADLIAWLAWHTYCECVTGSPTDLGSPTTYPTTGPTQQNPGNGNITTPTNMTCFTGSDPSTYNFASTGAQRIFVDQFPMTNLVNSGVTTAVMNVIAHIFTAPGFAISFSCQPQDVHNTNIGSPVVQVVSSGATGSISIPVPANTAFVNVTATSGAGSGDTQLYDPTTMSIGINWAYYCNGATPGGPSMYCCPPDPNVQWQLTQIQNMLAFIYSNLPVRVPNYAAGTVHSAVSAGSIPLDPTTIAVLITVDSYPLSYGQIAGTPNTFFGLGYMSPVNNEGPMAGVRITRSAEVFALPDATISLDLDFPVGMTADVTELQAG